MFVADDKAARKEAYDLVRESDIMASYLGFALGHTDLGKVMALGGESIPEFTDTIGSHPTECIRLFSQLPTPESAPRSEAGGGIILWKGMRMLLTVNHFSEETRSTATSREPEDDDCEITGLEDFDDTDEVDATEVDVTSQGSVSDRSDVNSPDEDVASSSGSTVGLPFSL